MRQSKINRRCNQSRNEECQGSPGRRQQGQDLDELDDRSGPAVADQKREDLLALDLCRVRLQVDEVDVESVDVGLELRELVDHLLLLAPVVVVQPIFAQSLTVKKGSVSLSKVATILNERKHPPCKYPTQNAS